MGITVAAVVILRASRSGRTARFGGTAGVSAYLQWIDRRERLENLFAASTPGAPGLFGEMPTPVNMLPALLNRYTGQSLRLRPDVGYAWTGGGFEEVDLGAFGT